MRNGEELAEAALEDDESGSTQVPGGDQGEHASVSSPSEPAQTGFVAYEAIRDALIARGIAPHEIAFIQNATTRAKREQLMVAVRSGVVRVLLAGSQNTGLNVQDRLLAVHNVDVPWRPGDLEQRIGRAQRQGNMWPEVFVCNYATEHSFDGYMWQANEVKAGFIEQFERGDVATREIDDIGGIVMTAAEMKAIASGNAQVRRKFQVESELARLDLLHVAWRTTQRTMQGRISEIENQCAQTRTNQALLDAAQTAIEAAATPEFHALVAQTIGSELTVLMNKRVEAGATVRDLAATICQLHGIEQVQQHEFFWSWMLEQRVVLAQYRGLLVECLIGKFKQAVMMLSLSRPGEPALLPETALASTTGRGVFDSADAAIRQFPARIAEYERRIESLTAERHTILAALEQPWEHEATYHALTEERNALFRALGPKDNPASAEADAEPGARDDTPSTTSAPEPAFSMIAPPVILSPLGDPAAMEAARERIKARDRERSAKRADASINQAILGANATREPLIILEKPGLAEQAHLDAVRALYQPAGKVVFGDVEVAKQRRNKGAKQTTQDEEPEQLSLFD